MDVGEGGTKAATSSAKKLWIVCMVLCTRFGSFGWREEFSLVLIPLFVHSYSRRRSGRTAARLLLAREWGKRKVR